MRQIYNTGARNFLFINVPPIDRTPGRDASDEASREHAAAYIQSFNTALGNSIDIFSANHSDTTIFQFDIFTLFNNVLDNPSSYEISSVIKNTTDSCDAYALYVSLYSVVQFLDLLFEDSLVSPFPPFLMVFPFFSFQRELCTSISG